MEEEVRPKALMIPFDKFVILDILPPEQYKNVVTQMRQYVELNREPEELQPIERMAFEALRPFMNENIKTYKRKIDAQHTNGMERHSSARAKEYGISYLGKADFVSDVKKLRAAGAEVVIAMPHWGAEYERRPDSYALNMARRMADAGVDVCEC